MGPACFTQDTKARSEGNEMNLTPAQKNQLHKLCAAYTKACNTGTGRQALAAEKRMNAYLDGLLSS
jgi:hypothetical protein